MAKTDEARMRRLVAPWQASGQSAARVALGLPCERPAFRPARTPPDAETALDFGGWAS
jgi:hypothetical protein